MDEDAKPLSAEDKTSFAYKTVKDRIPEILTKLVDGLHRNGIVNDDGSVDRESAKKVISHLSRLRYEVMTDKPLEQMDPAHADDHETWNTYLQKYKDEHGKDPSWFTAPWLYWECYLYRYLQVCASMAGVPQFDIFRESKRKQLLDSQAAMATIANFMEDVIPTGTSITTKKEELFRQFLQVCFWGNECDLSISGMAENAQSRDPLTSLSHLAEKIIVNNTTQVWNLFSSSSSPIAVTIILDNAGFELFADLCFADFLLRSKLASSVTFFGKAVPWFVSDVTKHDFQWTIDHVKERDGPLGALGSHWAELLSRQSFIYDTHNFFTSPFDFAVMETKAPELYRRLSESQLIILKGDLNYRKLVGDRQWPTTTEFHRALRGFHPAPILSLRLCKADVVVGLQAGVNEKLGEETEDWMCIGKYGVIQTDL